MAKGRVMAGGNWASVIFVSLSVLSVCQPARGQGYQGAESASVIGISVTECTVSSDTTTNKFDCTAIARRTCHDVPKCELPIGYTLTGARDIDGNERTWEKVVVTYRCGAKELVRGPHDQNPHAAMVLSCSAR